MWDTRAETAILSFYGPHVCGDALDLAGTTLLTGSYLYGDGSERNPYPMDLQVRV